MESYQYDSVINKPVEMPLLFDGEKQGTYLIYPIISFVRRGAMIRNIIDSVVSDGEFLPFNLNFSIIYYLIQTYTDLVFPDAEIMDVDGEDEDTRAARQRDANYSLIVEFIQRTDVVKQMRETVLGYNEIIEEVRAGIEFEKQRALHKTSWEAVGDQIQNLLSAFNALIGSHELVEHLSSLLNVDDTDDATALDNQ